MSVAKATDWISKANSNSLPAQVIISFEKLPNAAERQALADNGIVLLDYLPENSFTAVISQKLEQSRMAATGNIWNVVDIRPEWKADNYLWSRAQAAQNKPVQVIVSLCAGATSQDLKTLVAAMEGSVTTSPATGHLLVTIAGSHMKDLAGWYGTRFITPYFEPVALDRQSVPAVHGNSAIAHPLWAGYGLDGDSVTVGVGDNTSGVFHHDLVDRIVNFNPASVTNHGIHINGITGGAAIINPLAQSMSPKVKLLDFFFSTVLSATGAMHEQYNMTITNNSYTVVAGDCDYFGTYDLYSRYLDTLALMYPTVQHVFAAGNDGKMTCGPYPAGYATMGGGYQPSKNTLVVGSTTHNLIQADDQSRGPVRDGRIRPDIVAVGASVFSCLRFDTYGWAGGTSMASPQVASGLAVLTQHYKRVNSEQPRADLLKTILIGTATDMGNPGPDFSFGFGMMDVGRALRVVSDSRYFTGDVTSGDSVSFTINIPDGIAAAKVTLCWNDQPASPAAATQLVNDLNLTVKGPDGTRRLPLVPDPAIANVLVPATEREDHLNNVEQISVSSPAAGTYTITVRGHSVPFGPQHFVVVYDLLPRDVELTFPLGGEQLSNVDSVRIFWSAVTDGNTFKAEFSFDGVNWSVIKDNIPADVRYCSFMPSGFNSGNCRVRISRNGTAQSVASQRFAVSDTVHVSLSAHQCPGYMNIHWHPVPFATAYEVLKKTGAVMNIVDTVTDTTYAFAGLQVTERAFVAVQPILNGLSGYRSLAVSRTPSDGDCMDAVSVGDLMIEKVLSPVDGRLYTSSAPGVTYDLRVRVRNLYSVVCGSYRFSYNIDGAGWQQLTTPAGILPAGATRDIVVPGRPTGTPGMHHIVVALHNDAVADPRTDNDTLHHYYSIIANDPLDLSMPYVSGFEDMDEAEIRHDTLGFTPDGHWDFSDNDDSGRIRSFVYDNVVITGSRSMSMDQFMPCANGSDNFMTGTFNLAAYDTAADEVRLDFDYLLHSIPNHTDGNIVQARGNESASWSHLFGYDFDAYPGFVRQARSLSVTDAVRRGGYNFSAATQIAFGQNDTTLIAGRDYGNGITIDNVRLYTVQNDAVLAGIVSPATDNCGLPGEVPLTVRVRNGVNKTLHNIQISYALDDGAVHTATIDSVTAKDSVDFSFQQLLDISVGTMHKLNVWLSATGDSYNENDSVMGYRFLNSPVITQYPYLEDFETGMGGFHATGYLSSWEYGTPGGKRIRGAASGSHAWKTNLNGVYNSLERSYLYSPCYDISSLSVPMLSFSMAQELENCGNILCDGAYIEYSFDGLEWERLGKADAGTNWYGNTFNLWNAQAPSRWRVATIPLPHPPANKVLHLRFVLFADPAVTFEGVAVDDIHIYDMGHPILPVNEDLYRITIDPTGGIWKDVTVSGQIAASVLSPASIGTVDVSVYRHDTLYDPDMQQHILPRSYNITTATSLTDSVSLRLYVEEKDIEAVINDTSCRSCPVLRDAYSLGVTQYININNKAAENGWLADDTGGVFNYYRASDIQWVPYANGYYASLKVHPLSELWLNDGGPTGTFPAGVSYLRFLAYRSSGGSPVVYWHSFIDTVVSDYILERSYDGVTFADVAHITSRHQSAAAYQYNDTSLSSLHITYYRLRWQVDGADAISRSAVRKLGETDTPEGLVHFTAGMTGAGKVQLGWTSWIDGMVQHYVLERAIGNGSFVHISSFTASGRYGQEYAYTDMPGDISAGVNIKYRLTAIMHDGSSVVMPERTVIWIDGAAVTGIYPNPTADGLFYIHWNADAGERMQIVISDLSGRNIEQHEVIATGWQNISPVKMRDTAPGIYIVRMSVGSWSGVRRLVRY